MSDKRKHIVINETSFWVRERDLTTPPAFEIDIDDLTERINAFCLNVELAETLALDVAEAINRQLAEAGKIVVDREDLEYAFDKLPTDLKSLAVRERFKAALGR
jgi:hypothetical protein